MADGVLDSMIRRIRSFGAASILTVSTAVGSLGLTACGKPQHDISRYFGKNEQQIKGMLGEPESLEETSRQARARAIALFGAKPTLYYPYGSQLPVPLKELEFFFSDAGLCHQISGRTADYDTPEEVLEAIGLGSLDKRLTSTDALGFDYQMGDYELVQVHKPSTARGYSSFNVFDREARATNP